MNFIKCTLLFIFILFSCITFSQEDSISLSKDEKDFILDWENIFEDKSLSFDTIKSSSFPTVVFSLNPSTLKRKDLKTKLSEPLGFELKLGSIQKKSFSESVNIIEEDFYYFILSNLTSHLQKKDNISHNIHSDSWKFGFGNQTGFGYKLNETIYFIPFTDGSINWTRINFSIDSNIVPLNDLSILNLYDESFRFGTSKAGGLRIKFSYDTKFFNSIVLETGFERHIVFQRLLFWKWISSSLIELGLHSLLDKFIDKVFDSSPYAAPILSFVFKNALNYGIYELKTEKMNYPFNTQAPISFNQFRFSIQIIF
jgi:hypothetical protein